MKILPRFHLFILAVAACTDPDTTSNPQQSYADSGADGIILDGLSAFGSRE